MNLRDSLMNASQMLVAKILIIGDPRVGKSCILSRFSDNYYTPDTLVTIGIDCKTKNIQIDDTTIKLQIWDTAGQERYKSITQNFYKNAMGVIIVFDLTNRNSFDSIQKWLAQVRTNSSEQACLLLVGNKSDEEENRAVSPEKIQMLSKETGIPYIEASAKKDINIKEIFEKIARDVKKVFLTDSQSVTTLDRNEPSIQPKLTYSSLKPGKNSHDFSRCC